VRSALCFGVACLIGENLALAIYLVLIENLVNSKLKKDKDNWLMSTYMRGLNRVYSSSGFTRTFY
jgi:hypothetical protein